MLYKKKPCVTQRNDQNDQRRLSLQRYSAYSLSSWSALFSGLSLRRWPVFPWSATPAPPSCLATPALLPPPPDTSCGSRSPSHAAGQGTPELCSRHTQKNVFVIFLKFRWMIQKVCCRDRASHLFLSEQVCVDHLDLDGDQSEWLKSQTPSVSVVVLCMRTSYILMRTITEVLKHI